jgi:hypothetical protein
MKRDIVDATPHYRTCRRLPSLFSASLSRFVQRILRSLLHTIPAACLNVLTHALLNGRLLILFELLDSADYTLPRPLTGSFPSPRQTRPVALSIKENLRPSFPNLPQLLALKAPLDLSCIVWRPKAARFMRHDCTGLHPF